MSGKYRDLVRVRPDSRTVDNPQPIYTGTPTYAKVPCDITAVYGMEVYRGRQLKAETTHVVEMQQMPNIAIDSRLEVIGGHAEGKTLHIMASRPRDYDGRAPKLELDCRELA